MKKVLKIEGMTCMHCAGAVKKELENLDGINSVTVDLKEKKATVEISENSIDTITDEKLGVAVDEAGYTLVSVQ